MHKETKKILWILSLCSGLGISANVVLGTISTLAALNIVHDKSLATVPFALQYVSSMFLTAPASFLMARFGRKIGFIIGSSMGVLGGLLFVAGVIKQSFLLFCVGGVCIGGANAYSFYYRFAASEIAGEAFRSRAISYIMAGGVLGAVVGPNLANWTSMSYLNMLYAGSLLSMCFLYVVNIILLLSITFPVIAVKKSVTGGRALLEIISQPKCIAAILSAMIGYGAMTFLMIATPMTMHDHAHALNDISFVIQWHVLGMFAPSFITGKLIQRYGLFSIMAIGALLNIIAIVVNLMGTTVGHYWVSLLALGIGWNFLFISATTLLTQTYLPEEKAKTEAFNDFCVFTTIAFTAYFSGVALNNFGWAQINLGALPWILILLFILLWFKKDINKSAHK